MTDSSVPSGSSFEPRAMELFFAFQDRRDRGEASDLDGLCASHPLYAEQFRAMDDLAQFAAGLRPPPLSDNASYAKHARAQREDPGPHSELFERLRASGARSERYQLLGEVARGGMGAVLRIWDHEFRRTLAMKVVLGTGDAASGDTTGVDTRTLGRFLEEAQITGQLDHPGIVPVHELGLDAAGRVYFTMKLVMGEDLKAVFEHVHAGDKDWNQVRALNVLLRVCEAVAFAHSKDVVHRDLKPANVMVGKFGEVYVMDWGLARVLGREDKHDLRIRPDPAASASVVRTERREQRDSTPDSPLVTMDGDVMGTPSYMPPEQARGQLDKLGPHSDVYSIGAMLYQLVTGRIPYVPAEGRVTNRTILDAVLHRAPEPIESLAPRTPPELVAIIEKAMERDIANRYPNTLALRDDLAAYLDGRVVAAYETGAWAESKKWVQRNRPLAAALAAALLALVGGVAFSVNFAREADASAQRAERGETQAREQTKRAEEGERLARENAEHAAASAAEAERNATTAQLARDISERTANDVLALSAQKDHDDLVAEAAKLWPAHPEMIPAYEDWLRRASELIDGRPADESMGQKKRASLAEHKAKLDELRVGAKPLSEAEVLAERESHPKYEELQAKQEKLLWLSRMLNEEPWPGDAVVEAELATESLPTDADALNALARSMLDPAQPVYGQEVRTAVLARRAVAAASEAKRSGIRDSLAWALFKLGRFDEALAEARAALSEVGGDALTSSAADLENAVDAWRGEELAKRREDRAALTAEVATLAAQVNERRTYEFDDPEKEWWNRQLVKLVSDLEVLRDPETGLMNDVLAEPFGWGVAKRYAFAKSIGERSVSGADATRLWSEAITAIKASPRYGDLEIVPQLGLLPIGMDPDSGLWEFAHLQTGDPAVRGADGKLTLAEETGLVFVLIPGGKFWMGAQNKPDAQNYDPQAESNEGPVHEVELSPFFLSKYEMTQGQWQRIESTNPSYYQPPGIPAPSLLHPVERVNWPRCFGLLESLGLTLPSEAQWECGARGGATTAWWRGQERESLRGHVNLADQTAKKAGARWSGINDWPDLEDGSVVHCEVGKYAANSYGLHEVAGNVWEWCLDGYDAGFYGKKSSKDPLFSPPDAADRVIRGGSFLNAASVARSAHRGYYTPETQVVNLGLRPAKALRLPPSPLHPPK